MWHFPTALRDGKSANGQRHSVSVSDQRAIDREAQHILEDCFYLSAAATRDETASNILVISYIPVVDLALKCDYMLCELREQGNKIRKNTNWASI